MRKPLQKVARRRRKSSEWARTRFRTLGWRCNSPWRTGTGHIKVYRNASAGDRFQKTAPYTYMYCRVHTYTIYASSLASWDAFASEQVQHSSHLLFYIQRNQFRLSIRAGSVTIVLRCHDSFFFKWKWGHLCEYHHLFQADAIKELLKVLIKISPISREETIFFYKAQFVKFNIAR